MIYKTYLIAKLIGLSSSSKAAKFTKGSGLTELFDFWNSRPDTLGAHLGVEVMSLILSRLQRQDGQLVEGRGEHN